MLQHQKLHSSLFVLFGISFRFVYLLKWVQASFSLSLALSVCVCVCCMSRVPSGKVLFAEAQFEETGLLFISFSGGRRACQVSISLSQMTAGEEDIKTGTAKFV